MVENTNLITLISKLNNNTMRTPKLSYQQIITYMVDVMGYDEGEARRELTIYGSLECLTDEQLQDCYSFSN